MSRYSSSQNESTPQASFASFARRVYPLNLKHSSKSFSVQNRSSKIQVPEFIKDYIKDLTPSQPSRKTKPKNLHHRSISYDYTPVPKPEHPEPGGLKTGIPVLSYKDFKGSHQRRKNEERYFKPQSIQVSQRSKITLYSANPIIINPNIYSQKDHSSKPFLSKKNSVLETGAAVPPGLTYGQKILKLKSLVESEVYN